jgi:hypothetical protein
VGPDHTRLVGKTIVTLLLLLLLLWRKGISTKSAAFVFVSGCGGSTTTSPDWVVCVWFMYRIVCNHFHGCIFFVFN